MKALLYITILVNLASRKYLLSDLCNSTQHNLDSNCSDLKSQIQIYNITYVFNDRRSNYRTLDACRGISTSTSCSYLTAITILLSNDIAQNPGQSVHTSQDSCTTYLCGTCDKAVNWSQRGIVCDTCQQWFHVSCQSMTSSTYKGCSENT